MAVIRLLLIVLVMVSASLSSAMEAEHAPASDHAHMSVETMAEEMPVCCDDSTKSGQSCHILPALLPGADALLGHPVRGQRLSAPSGLPLVGIDLSGPLDPPRLL